MLVSILVAAYNCEKTIKRCLDSILNQTNKDFECVIIDDASTDNTNKIISEYAEKHKDIIRLFRNDSNKGCGITRKFGITRCKGDFIMFVDSDDWIESDYVERMTQKQKETDADFVNCFIKVENEEDNIHNHFSYYNTLDFKEGVYEKHVSFPHVWMNIGKMIRRSIFDKVSYSESRFDEDGMTHFKCCYYANKICFFNYYGYHYSLNSTSLCHSLNSTKSMFYAVLINFEMHDFYKDKPEIKAQYFVNLDNLFMNGWSKINGGVDEFKYKNDALRLSELVEKHKYLLKDYCIDNYNSFVNFYKSL